MTQRLSSEHAHALEPLLSLSPLLTQPLEHAYLVTPPVLLLPLIAHAASRLPPGPQDSDFPLFMAAQNGHKEVVELLVAAGGDVNGKINVRYVYILYYMLCIVYIYSHAQ